LTTFRMVVEHEGGQEVELAVTLAPMLEAPHR